MPSIPPPLSTYTSNYYTPGAVEVVLPDVIIVQSHGHCNAAGVPRAVRAVVAGRAACATCAARSAGGGRGRGGGGGGGGGGAVLVQSVLLTLQHNLLVVAHKRQGAIRPSYLDVPLIAVTRPHPRHAMD